MPQTQSGSTPRRDSSTPRRASVRRSPSGRSRWCRWVRRRSADARAWRYVVFSFCLAAIGVTTLAIGYETYSSIEALRLVGKTDPPPVYWAGLVAQPASVAVFAAALVRLASPAITTWPAGAAATRPVPASPPASSWSVQSQGGSDFGPQRGQVVGGRGPGGGYPG
ncbi:hypothetical protein [Cryptosporangium sp. NPDC051539]|uniref:hypothetical protein n=1 Tax=Cryptosporangium sp. NPDC051539 TaxID=3363962 RepID=UPI0037931614